MVQQRLIFMTWLLSVSLVTSGCFRAESVPTDLVLDGSSGGCGDFVLYRFNADRTWAVYIEVPGSSPGSEPTSRKIDLSTEAAEAKVQILRFKDPAGTYFCDDVGGDPPPVSQWTAISGMLWLEISEVNQDESGPSGQYRVSAQLEMARFQGVDNEPPVSIERLGINDIVVGWYAG